MIVRPQENAFEESLIIALSAGGQSAAYELFTRESLPTLLQLWLRDGLPQRIREIHEPAPGEANEILRAALIAKLTYILPDNPHLTSVQRRYLTELALTVAGHAPENHDMTATLDKLQARCPILFQWLQRMQAASTR